jgi:hypothetical protein
MSKAEGSHQHTGAAPVAKQGRIFLSAIFQQITTSTGREDGMKYAKGPATNEIRILTASMPEMAGAPARILMPRGIAGWRDDQAVHFALAFLASPFRSKIRREAGRNASTSATP